jgi:hypothetical protein
VVEDTGARFGLNVISAISVEGELRFHLEKDNVNSDSTLAILAATGFLPTGRVRPHREDLGVGKVSV